MLCLSVDAATAVAIYVLLAVHNSPKWAGSLCL